MEGIEHKTIKSNGIDIHIAQKGTQGPIILFLHGFPELWYSWRHQLHYFAANGYRAIAPDLRGYGDTIGPPPNSEHTQFTTFHVVADIVALIDVITENDNDADKVFVVGHDWGAYMAWHLSLYRPDKVKALVNLSVYFLARKPEVKPVEGIRFVYGEDHYICRFQEPGVIEAEFANAGTKTVLKKFMTYRDTAPYFFPKGQAIEDTVLPSWLTEEDIDYYTSKFEKTGFSGGVNYYRAFDLDWELNAPWTGAKITVPTKFIVGDLDLVYHFLGAKDYIHNGGFQRDVPNLKEIVVIEGAAHFINQEKPDEINKHIHDFLLKF